MRKSPFYWLGALVLLIGAGNVAGGEEKDREALQGTWISEGEAAVKSITFMDKKVVVEFAKGEKTAAFHCIMKLHVNANPKGIDLTVKKAPVGKSVGKTSLGIYKLQNGKLTWCSAAPGQEKRPTEFMQQIGDRRFMLVTFSKKK